LSKEQPDGILYAFKIIGVEILGKD